YRRRIPNRRPGIPAGRGFPRNRGRCGRREAAWSKSAPIRRDPVASAGATLVSGSLWILRREPLLSDLVQMFLQVLDTVSRNHEHRVVGFLHELLLDEEPQRELEVLARGARQFFEIAYEQARSVRLESTTSVQDFQNRRPKRTLAIEVARRGASLRNQP